MRDMSKYKKRLIFLLFIQMLLTFNYVALDKEPVAEGMFFWFGLSFGFFVVLYAFSIRCPNSGCKRRQVFREWPLGSISMIRWPDEKCYYCGTSLSAKYENGRPV
jgi:hypothetical protein